MDWHRLFNGKPEATVFSTRSRLRLAVKRKESSCSKLGSRSLECDLILQPIENAVLADFEVGAGAAGGVAFEHGRIKRNLALV